MNGYWKNKGTGSSSTPGEDEGVQIGLPPVIRGTKNGNYIEGLYIAGEGSDWTITDLNDVNVRCFKKTLNPGTYSTPDWPYPDKDGDYYMSLPSGFKGYITHATDGTPSPYKTILDGDPAAQVITTQNVYKVGIDVYKLVFPVLGGETFPTGSIYGDIEKAGRIFKERLFDETNIPVFTGSFRDGTTGKQQFIMKQNRHYAGLSVGEEDLLTPGMMSRYYIYGNTNYNTTSYGSGAGDTMFSMGNAEGGILRNGRTTLSQNLWDWATSGTNAGILPWGVNFTGGARVLYNSTRGNFVDTTRPRMTPFASRAFQHKFETSEFKTVGNTMNNLYNSRYSWIMEPLDNYMGLPALPQNVKVYGGTGDGILDVPIIDTYQHPRVSDWSFRYDDPARYAFIECTTSTKIRTAIFIVTYLTNDVIEITT